MPTVATVKPLEQAVAEQEKTAVKWIAAIGGDSLDAVAREMPSAVDTAAVLVGPEGGFTADEVAMAVAGGFRRVALSGNWHIGATDSESQSENIHD